MNKKLNNEYKGLYQNDVMYDYTDGNKFRKIEILYAEDEYYYSVRVDDRHYDYYEGKCID